MTISLDENNLIFNLNMILDLGENENIIVETEQKNERVKYTAIINKTKIQLDNNNLRELSNFLQSIRDGNPTLEISNDSIQDFIKISIEADKNVCNTESKNT